MEQHIHEMEVATRKMSVHVNALVKRTKTSDNFLKASFGFGHQYKPRTSGTDQGSFAGSSHGEDDDGNNPVTLKV